MSNQWLRLWHELPNDPKWRTIARVSKQRIGDVIAVYVHHLVIASANANERGRTRANDNEDIANALDLELDQVQAIWDAMQGRVMDGEEVKGWHNRQPEREDGSSERAKKWRENKKLQANNEGAKDAANACERTRTQENAKERPDTDTDTEVSTQSSLRSDCGAESADENVAPPASPDPELPAVEDDSLRAAIFEVGRPVMLAGGCSDKSAGSLLGKLRKELGDLEALVVVEAMKREAPLNAAEWVAGAIKSRVSKGKTFFEFITDCRAKGEPAISEYEPMYEYAKKAGIPIGHIEVAWEAFKRRHGKDGIFQGVKREDWRLSFLYAVETNMMRLWYFDRGKGQFLLTTSGVQADEATREAA